MTSSPLPSHSEAQQPVVLTVVWKETSDVGAPLPGSKSGVVAQARNGVLGDFHEIVSRCFGQLEPPALGSVEQNVHVQFEVGLEVVSKSDTSRPMKQLLSFGQFSGAKLAAAAGEIGFPLGEVARQSHPIEIQSAAQR